MSIAEYFASMDYAPDLADERVLRDWLASLRQPAGSFVGGAMTAAATHAPRAALADPGTGDVLLQVADGASADIDAALRSARTVQPAWQQMGGARRASQLQALARHVQQEAPMLALLLARLQGQVLARAQNGDVSACVRGLRHAAELARWQLGDPAQGPLAALPQAEAVRQVRKTRRSQASGVSAGTLSDPPAGVVAVVVGPQGGLRHLVWKASAALAAGRCVVLQPAGALAPIALWLAQLASRAGLPDGVLNVVPGGAETRAALAAHAAVDVVDLADSITAARTLRTQLAGLGKTLRLTLAGRRAFLVFDSADQDAAADAVAETLCDASQSYGGGLTLLVQEGISRDFQARLHQRLGALRRGDVLSGTVDLGPLEPAAAQRLDHWVSQARAQGAQVWQAAGDPAERAVSVGAPGSAVVSASGPVPSPARPRTAQEGSFYPPTLVCGALPDTAQAVDTLAGPVAVLETFRTVDEAIALANHARARLSVSLWSGDVSLSLDAAARLSAGMVWINSLYCGDPLVPVGGAGECGAMADGGPDGLLDYLGAPVAAPGATGRVSKAGHASMRGPVSGQVAPSVVVPPLHAGLLKATTAARKAQAGWHGAGAVVRAAVLDRVIGGLLEKFSLSGEKQSAVTGQKHAAAEGRNRAGVSESPGLVHASMICQCLGALRVQLAQSALTGDRSIRLSANSRALCTAEPLGVIGIASSGALPPGEATSLALIEALMSALAAGNAVVLACDPHVATLARDVAACAQAAGIPAGVLNVVVGDPEALARGLAAHDGVDALWAFGLADCARDLEALSAGNLKRLWLADTAGATEAAHRADGACAHWRQHQATQPKVVCVSYGA